MDIHRQQTQAVLAVADCLVPIVEGSGGRAGKTPMHPVTVGFQSFYRRSVSNRMEVIASRCDSWLLASGADSFGALVSHIFVIVIRSAQIEHAVAHLGARLALGGGHKVGEA